MTLKKCRTCGEDKIIWDMRRVGDRANDEWECLDDCYASYDKHVGIKLVAPEATEEQKQRVIDSALDLCKSYGTAKEAAKALRYLSFKVDPENADVLVEDDLPSVGLGHLAAAADKAERKMKEVVMSLEELTREHGFAQPEDGAEDRYHERKARQSPLRHRFWWLVHNAVAHPLIAFVPRRASFRFHDWTSRKLHGQ